MNMPNSSFASPVTLPTESLRRFIPMTKQEMQARGWSQLDILLISGDAYVDHPAFGLPLLARVLESRGFRVGLIAQPAYPGSLVHRDDGHPVTEAEALARLQRLGSPRLFVGIGAGVVDSRVSNFTANKKRRSDDAYAPGGRGGFRPDEASLVYTQMARQAFGATPIILGGVEASLRRLAHYDFWRNRSRPSLLYESQADLLLFGMAETSLVQVSVALRESLEQGKQTAQILRELRALRGVAWLANREEAEAVQPRVLLPAFSELRDDKKAFARSAKIIEHEANPWAGKALLQKQKSSNNSKSYVVVNPAPLPLSSGEFDAIYALPFSREAHPFYYHQALLRLGDPKQARRQSRIPALDTVRFSITINRGCFGGCSFCAIGLHQGKTVQSRSEKSILQEIDRLAQHPEYKGVISDLGGPTANMYRLGCTRPDLEKKCRRPSCVFPQRCPHLGVDHGPQVKLLRRVRQDPKVRRAFVASGLRYDLIDLKGPYLRELLAHHVGGHLKVAPEHADDEVLRLMRKPGFSSFEDFAAAFGKISKQLGKEQYLVPYFISAFPGTTDGRMARIARWLDRRHWRLQQVQTFIPLPMTLAAAMYWTGINPLNKERLYVPRSDAQRRRQQRLLQGGPKPLGASKQSSQTTATKDQERSEISLGRSKNKRQSPRARKLKRSGPSRKKKPR